MNDAVAFLKAILAGQWDAAGAFADWLDERGDPRGVLLRRRWRRWQKEVAKVRAAAAAKERELTDPLKKTLADLRAAGWEVRGHVHAKVAADTRPEDGRFRAYLRIKFPTEYLDATPMDANSQAYKDS